ncbi:hypothetical protein KJ786_01045 [Patescibacteria group bacterium]|nr:hypothetical protein [Patescibacteria group bacterium]
MKKLFLIFFVFVLLIPAISFVHGESIVSCADDPCSFQDFQDIIPRIINFIMDFLVLPLSILFLTIGGIVLLISGGNPELKNTGKKILIATVIGMVLAYGSVLIINFILGALGSTYTVGP